MGSLPHQTQNQIGAMPSNTNKDIGSLPPPNMHHNIGSLPHFLQERHVYGKYIVNEWNINGFKSISNPYNTVFKQSVVGTLYSDFWILPETHCMRDETIDLESYIVYHYNRDTPSKSRRGSGGIAIAVHNSILDSHTVISVSKGIDGQLGLKLKNKSNDFLLGIVGLYLSPDSYIYGQDPENFFNEAAVIWKIFWTVTC